VTFLVGPVPYVLAFGTVQAPDAGPFGEFTLEGLTPQGGAQMAVTLRSPTPTAVPPDLSFICLPSLLSTTIQDLSLSFVATLQGASKCNLAQRVAQGAPRISHQPTASMPAFPWKQGDLAIRRPVRVDGTLYLGQYERKRPRNAR